jgi:hypothetical protein
MLNATLAAIAAVLWLTTYGLFFAGDIAGWWRLRPYHRAVSEMERLQAVRTYAAWIRAMPPPPPRPPRGPLLIPTAEHPPIGGVIVPYPGRRIAGD